eukprot:114875_1
MRPEFGEIVQKVRDELPSALFLGRKVMQTLRFRFGGYNHVRKLAHSDMRSICPWYGKMAIDWFQDHSRKAAVKYYKYREDHPLIVLDRIDAKPEDWDQFYTDD